MTEADWTDKEATELLAKAYGLAKKKTEFVDRLHKLPYVVATCHLESNYGDGFRKCLDLYASHVPIVMVGLVSGLGPENLFISDRAAFVAHLNDFIASVHAIPSKPTPSKVVAKMVALRIKKALSNAKNRQTSFDTERKSLQLNLDSNNEKAWAQNNPAQQQIYRNNWIRRLTEIKDYPKLDMTTADKAAVLAWMASCYKPEFEWTQPVAVYTELEKFLGRPDVTEEMVRMAFDMILVDEVMES